MHEDPSAAAHGPAWRCHLSRAPVSDPYAPHSPNRLHDAFTVVRSEHLSGRRTRGQHRAGFLASSPGAHGLTQLPPRLSSQSAHAATHASVANTITLHVL